jgi:3-oxoadipate enol-lactonase
MVESTVSFVDGPAGRIAYRRRGTGPALVVLHPLALSGVIWEPVVDRLAADFDVITPDARGHGDSDWDGRPFGIEDLAEDVAALLDGVGLASADLLGMSMGGSTAIAFAGLHPARVERLALADTTAWYGATAVQTWHERADRVLATTRAEQIPFQVDRWFTQFFLNTHPVEVRDVVRVFLATASPAHAQACRALGEMDSRPLLPAITAPTFAFAGEEDYATPPEMATTVAEGVPDGSALTLPGLRHLSLVERPEVADLAAAHLLGKEIPTLDAVRACGCPTPVVVAR